MWDSLTCSFAPPTTGTQARNIAIGSRGSVLPDGRTRVGECKDVHDRDADGVNHDGRQGKLLGGLVRLADVCGGAALDGVIRPKELATRVKTLARESTESRGTHLWG